MGATPGVDGDFTGRPWMAAATQVFVTSLDAAEDPVLDDPTAHHLGRVLRLRAGEVVCAADGIGGWALTTWTGDGRLEVTGAAGRVPRSLPKISVGFVPAKGDRPELVTRMLAELGVDRIVVTSSDRSVVRWDGERGRRHLDRLGRVAVEASAQARRLWVPIVATASLRSLLADGSVLADLDGDGPDESLRSIVVGPEGGWTAAERAMSSVRPVSLGDHVLRAETAAIAAGMLLSSMRHRPTA